jgi:hypothetical protein
MKLVLSSARPCCALPKTAAENPVATVRWQVLNTVSFTIRPHASSGGRLKAQAARIELCRTPRPSRPPNFSLKDISGIGELTEYVMNQVVAGKLDPKVANAASYLASIALNVNAARQKEAEENRCSRAAGSRKTATAQTVQTRTSRDISPRL